jgi:glycosyltransferase involved in cell wall biosynthesis
MAEGGMMEGGAPGGGARSRAPLICWIVANSVPYHEARIKAAAETGRVRVCMIQITEMDSFKILQQARESDAIQRFTLFPGIPWDEIDGREMAKRLQARLSEIRPDVVFINGWSFGGGLAALRWGLSRDVPVVVMSETTAYDERRQWWREGIKRRIVGLCPAALVGGRPHRDYMMALGLDTDRIFTGYDAVDNDHFRCGAAAARERDPELRASLGLPQRYFIACSRFTPKKNLFRLVNAYARYRRLHDGDAWSLVIVGDGEQKQELLRLCDRLRVTDCVLLPGPKPYSELPAHYGLAGAFVHASTTEQWGLVVNEAMASGLPVLVSNRCGCAPDLVEEGRNGFLFDPYDISGLANAMYSMAAERTDRAEMGQASQAIIARWSPQNFADNLARAAERALDAARPRPSIVDRAILQILGTR